jgi:hypothetical protein
MLRARSAGLATALAALTAWPAGAGAGDVQVNPIVAPP